MVFLNSFSKINKKYPQNFLSPKCKKCNLEILTATLGSRKLSIHIYLTSWKYTRRKFLPNFFCEWLYKIKTPHFICFFLVKMSLPHFFLKMFPRKLIIIFLKKLKFLIQSLVGCIYHRLKLPVQRAIAEPPMFNSKNLYYQSCYT